MSIYARNNQFFTETLPNLGSVLTTRITDHFQMPKTAS